MNKADSLYERSLEEIGAFAVDLYAEAEARIGGKVAEDETSPLFQSLKGIRNRYEGPELIGRGGMKEVFRVCDLRSTRHVAMAKPLASLGENDYDAFLREAHITARLDHPGIVKLFDMGIDEDGRPFFTMELKRGRSLREKLREVKEGGEFPLRQRLSMFLRVCEAIAYAHSRRVLHLDLKPENIQVGEFGEVQVCDWGMGVVLRAPEGDWEETEVFLDPDLYGPLMVHSRGTPGYMAPEQLKAGQAKSFAMDIYSLGCLLQELMTLRAPNDPELPEPTENKVLHAIVDKARDRNPARRYAAVTELHRDLSRYLAGYSTTVERAGFAREAQLFIRRHRIACGLVAGLVFLIAAGTAVFIVELRLSRDEAKEAQRVAERAQALFQAEKLEAEAALRNYLAAREESDRRLNRHAHSVAELTTGRFLMDDELLPTMVTQGLMQLDAIIALDPPPESPAWRQKFYLLFLSQDLEGALNAQRSDMDKRLDLIALARKYAPHQDGAGPLPTPVFRQLMVDLVHCRAPDGGNRLSVMERMLIYDMQFPRTDEERVAILRDVLAALNPEAPELKLTFKSQWRSLRVEGSQVRVLSLRDQPFCSDRSLLRFLNPLGLNLHGTAVADLGELNGLHLMNLNIGNTKVKDLQPLTRMRSLQKLDLSPGQFTEEELSILRLRQ
jgi:hypothetical protein